MICRNAASSPIPAPSPVSPSQRARARPELGCRGVGCGRGAGGALGIKLTRDLWAALPCLRRWAWAAAPLSALQFGPQIASGSADPRHCASFGDPPLRSHKATRVPESTQAAPVKPKCRLRHRGCSQLLPEKENPGPTHWFLCPKTPSRGRGREHFWEMAGKGHDESHSQS